MNFAPFSSWRTCPFSLEDAQLRAHRGIARIAGQVLHDLDARGPAATVEDVHDLAFAPAEAGGLGHVSLLAAGCSLLAADVVCYFYNS